LLATVAANADPADQVASEVVPAAGEPQQKDDSVPLKKGRLRFKSSGPVCMCAEGMSERDIEKKRIRFKQDKSEEAVSGAGR
jgi:hypothetical protein